MCEAGAHHLMAGAHCNAADARLWVEALEVNSSIEAIEFRGSGGGVGALIMRVDKCTDADIGDEAGALLAAVLSKSTSVTSLRLLGNCAEGACVGVHTAVTGRFHGSGWTDLVARSCVLRELRVAGTMCVYAWILKRLTKILTPIIGL